MQNKLKKMIKIIQYIHHNPGKHAKTIIVDCGISEATFFRYINDLRVQFNVKIESKNGFHVFDYGYIDSSKL